MTDFTAEIERAGGSAAYHLTALSDIASVHAPARWAVAAGTPVCAHRSRSSVHDFDRWTRRSIRV